MILAYNKYEQQLSEWNYYNILLDLFNKCNYTIHNNTKETIDIIENLEEVKPDLSYVERWVDFHLYMKHSIRDGETFNNV